jgi:hypothetical protein
MDCFDTELCYTCFVEMFRFSICGLIIKVRDLRTGTPKKFAEMGYRNEPKNLQEMEFGKRRLSMLPECSGTGE